MGRAARAHAADDPFAGRRRPARPRHAPNPARRASRCSIRDGVLVLHVELRSNGRSLRRTTCCSRCWPGASARDCSACTSSTSSGKPRWRCSTRSSAPQLPGGFAVRYQPATRPLQVGGDWYDVVDLDDGRIALIVGDCVGHGLAAATVMGQLRSACRALLLEHPSPGAALTALDRFAARLPGARCTTAFCAVLTRTPVSWCTPAPAIRRRSWSWPTAPPDCSTAPRHATGSVLRPVAPRRPRDPAAAVDADALHRRSGRAPS